MTEKSMATEKTKAWRMTVEWKAAVEKVEEEGAEKVEEGKMIAMVVNC